jgi:hypothetical protein
VKITCKNYFSTIEPISTNNRHINSARQAETHRNFKKFSKYVLGEQSGNFHGKNAPLNNFSTVRPILTKWCTIDLIQLRLRKTANIMGKKLLSLKPVVRTRRSYERAELTKRHNSFQRLAVYSHEVLTSLQTRGEVFGAHFSLSCK